MLEIACWNGEAVRVAFAIDTHDREVMAWVASTGGVRGTMVRDLMLACVEARFGGRFSRGEAIRAQHANIVSWHPVQPPDAVVFPESVAEVSEIVRTCAAHRIPIVPFGTGSSLEAGCNAPEGTPLGSCLCSGRAAGRAAAAGAR